MKKLSLFILLIYLVGCSAMQESEKDNSNEKQNVYVFDDISTSDTTSTEAKDVTEASISKKDTSETSFQFFIVQVGAFSTLEKAETFVEASFQVVKLPSSMVVVPDSEVNPSDVMYVVTKYELNIHYSDEKKLHVVQLPPFRTKEKAEEVRDELWKISDFNGAFIVVPNK